MTVLHYLVVQPAHIARLSEALPSLLSGDWSEAALHAMQEQQHQLRVLLSDDEVVAFAEFQWVADECQLFNMAVLPRWQRRGLGRRLLQCVLQESRRQRMTSCVLEVRESNAGARRLYEREKFVVTGRRPGYYPPLGATGERETALLYCCGLSGAEGG